MKRSTLHRDYRVLIADDDRGFRETLEFILEPYFRTLAVECAEQAIEVVEHDPIDLVLFDMHMHVLTGLEAVSIVKKLRSDLPCILITADFTESLKMQALQAQAHAVLKKPVARRDLILQVGTALCSTYNDPELAEWLAC
ncbi:MAG: response regulator [Planctomycetaceae bacterium]